MRRSGRWAWLFWGVCAIVTFLIASWHVRGFYPVRLLYEGFSPLPPYRWVRPPTTLASRNEPPPAWIGSVPFITTGSQSASLATGDVQMIAVFPQRALAMRPGESGVRVTLMPQDPETLSTAPPGLQFDGNAYRVEALYEASRQPAVLQGPVTVVLRFPRHATLILRFDGSGTWMPLQSTVVRESMQIFATTDRLGSFVLAAPLGSQPREIWWAYVAAVLVMAAAAAGFISARRRDRKDRRKGSRRNRASEARADLLRIPASPDRKYEEDVVEGMRDNGRYERLGSLV